MRLRLIVLVLTLTVLLAGCASEQAGQVEADSDGDGLTDVQEQAGWEVTVLTPDANTTYVVTSDPEDADTDGDGFTDWDEFWKRTDPRKVDTDGDGLVDGKALTLAPGSDEARAYRAMGLVEDPLTPGRFPGEADYCAQLTGLHPLEWNSDRPIPDGLGDGEEIAGWDVTVGGETRRVFSSPCTPDTDGDGLLDHEEKARGTDPARKDTDGDDVWDSLDADPFHDLGLRVRVTHLELRDAPPGGNLTLTISVAGDERSFPLLADAGTQEVNVTHAVNVDDTTADLARLDHTVLLRVAGDAGPLAIAPSGDPAVVTFDLLGGAWTFERRTGHEALETDGGQASVRIELEAYAAGS